MTENKIPLITNLMVQITNQCNMECAYCFVNKNIQRMTYQTLYNTVQFIINNSNLCGIPPRLVFFGGEPLLEWDSLIVPITNYIRNEYKKPFILSMTTNGVLLTEDKIKFMVDNEISALYSIDGNENTMNINRPLSGNQSSFNIVSTNLRNMLQYTPYATARITLYQPTVSNLYSDIKYIHSLGFKRYSILPNLFDEWTDENIQAFKEQITLYGNYLLTSFRNNRDVPIYEQYVKAFSHIILINNAHKNNEYQCRKECQGCSKCGFGLNHFATEDYLGNIYGCLHQDHLDIDSVFYLGDIYNGIDYGKCESLINRYDDAVLGGIDCGNCKLSRVCDRGCAPNNLLYSGELKTPPPMYCHYNRILLDDAIRVCNILGQEQNEKFKNFFRQQIKGLIYE